MSPVLIAFGIIFICIGSVLLHVSLDTPEFSLDYTHCVAHQDHLNRSCAEILSWQHGGTCECIVEITLEQHFPRDVFFYYGLENFHQNHRMFVRSRDDGQLRGNIDKDPSPYCDPYRYTEHNNQTRPVAPCGLIANAIFNDSFSLHQLPSRRLVPLVGGGSVWAHERELKFRNPPDVDLREALEAHNISRPPSWSRELWELDPANPENNGFQNEDLINWMRSAALPSFQRTDKLPDTRYGARNSPLQVLRA
ncbi:cell cycle control protein 50A-like [Anopheles nili]|uniref:cell cycle control protein 50A-like n=1 Tax=Anopheles nili TaxID=185578 RepID=UPI00237A9E73|nr:cell cycle control protein 50A-like [Anopheles nili]